jgi:hypothetical protein
MPSAAANIKSIRYTPGGGNAPGIHDTIRIAFMEELRYGTLPAPVENKHLISTDVLFRLKVAVDATATPPITEEIPAGGCIAIEVVRKKSGYKLNGKAEEGYTAYEPTLEVLVPETHEETSFTLRNLNGARIILFFTDNNGRTRVAVNVLVKVDGSIDDNSNSYKLMFDFGHARFEPYIYTGAVPIRA